MNGCAAGSTGRTAARPPQHHHLDMSVQVTNVANAMQSVSAVAKTGLDKYIKARGDGLHVLLADKFAQYVRPL